MSRLVVQIVTDPMCSWCWGMSGAVEEAAHQLAPSVEFDFLLGGINTHGTQPIGEFGRRHLMKIWQEVHDVTGQPFGFRLPDEFVYNSTLPGIALEALRRHTGLAPFGFLHRLQQAFFVDGQNINHPDTLATLAGEFGWRREALLAALDDPALHEAAGEQFATSRRFGTNALPNVLVDIDGERRLLLGGYADSATLTSTLQQALVGRV